MRIIKTKRKLYTLISTVLIVLVIIVCLSRIYHTQYSPVALINYNWNIDSPLSYNTEVIFSTKGGIQMDGVEMLKVTYNSNNINKIKQSLSWEKDQDFYSKIIKLDNGLEDDKNLVKILKNIQEQNNDFKYSILTSKDIFLMILLKENAQEVYFLSNTL